MEDAKIDAIARDVLTSLKKARAEGASPETPMPSPSVDPLHPSLYILTVTGGVLGSPCIVEPDKPCVGSLRCRTFGH